MSGQIFATLYKLHPSSALRREFILSDWSGAHARRCVSPYLDKRSSFCLCFRREWRATL